MVQIEDYGPVKALQMGRKLLGVMPPFMTVRCYAVDGLLIDTGIYSKWRHVRRFARENKIQQLALTHHHEDHSGNARRFVKKGLPVWASATTAAIMAKGFDLHFYEKIIWGKAPKAQLKIFPPEVQTPHYRFRVLPAPGHSIDQVVLHEAEQGWLFSADAFLAEKVKIFRADEDFTQMVMTLKMLMELNVRKIFCAHRPVMKNAREALRRKLDYMLELEQEVNKLALQGYDLEQITEKTLGPEDATMKFLTQGDVCKQNMVRNILFGPEEREEFKKLTVNYNQVNL